MNEIPEYPYSGTITKVVQGKGSKLDTEELIYEGVMDEHTVTEQEGRTLQTSNYIISIPLIKDSSDKWIVPNKGDKVTVTRFDQSISFVVDNAEPSMLGGVSIYCSRKSW